MAVTDDVDQARAGRAHPRRSRDRRRAARSRRARRPSRIVGHPSGRRGQPTPKARPAGRRPRARSAPSSERSSALLVIGLAAAILGGGGTGLVGADRRRVRGRGARCDHRGLRRHGRQRRVPADVPRAQRDHRLPRLACTRTIATRQALARKRLAARPWDGLLRRRRNGKDEEDLTWHALCGPVRSASVSSTSR